MAINFSGFSTVTSSGHVTKINPSVDQHLLLLSCQVQRFIIMRVCYVTYFDDLGSTIMT